MRFRVWLRNVAQAETSVLVHCSAGFVNPLTTTFLVVCGILNHGNVTGLANNIPNLLFVPMEQTNDAHHCLDQRNQLTPWSRVLPGKLKCPKILKKFPAFYGT